ncbi:recombinase family protein [Acidaminobacter sp.]|uniref:recombinase family protein n=1 Tax=Acidaminobacter sp. TaxID=1872102 RepID=UPI002565FDEA|nr:recombinase family protein [Acidaminobacter sp.]MDK9711214.1 recombinase family protein [Acidaminobacter sp.]
MDKDKYVIALYIRLSLEDSKYDSMSIDNQRIALREYAESLSGVGDIEILEFVDNGYSGTNFERPAVQELLELVREYKIDCVIVKDFSRFGRNSIEMGYFIEQVFPLFRTRFISIGDGYDSINYKEDTGGIEVAFKYIIGEYYSKDLSEKSKSAKYAKMRRGEYRCKTCPYGYKSGKDKQMEIDDEAAEIVKMIFDLSLAGKTAYQIVETLYNKKIPTPGEYKAARGNTAHDTTKTNGIWQRATVLRILEDERYTGTYILGKRTVKEIGGNKSRLKDKSEWFTIPDSHPAIISKETYDKVQSKLRHCKNDKKVFKEYPLRSKAFCGCCEHALYRLPKKEPVFTCKHSRVDASLECHGLQIAESELEELLFRVISKQAEIILSLDNVVNLNEYDVSLAKNAEYEKQLRALGDQKRGLYERFLSQDISLEEYKAAKAACDDDIENLNRLSASAATSITQFRMDSTERSKIQTLARDVKSESKLTRPLVEKLIDKVRIFPGNRIEVDWKIKDFCGIIGRNKLAANF